MANEKFCFIIGPMKDEHLREEARLKRLKREVIQPLLTEIERRDGTRYIVRTPYDLPGGHIMNDVIHAIDRADLVIADVTDSNPNVFYELGICHCLGRACIVVLEDDAAAKIQFDLAAYRAWKINLSDQRYSDARDIVRPAIEKAHAEISDWTRFENPVIDYYRAPVTYISPAYSLAQGYYHNFVRPVVEAMLKRKGKGYLYDIEIGAAEKPVSNEIQAHTLMDDMIRHALELHIVVPGRIDMAKHNYADRLRGTLENARIEGDGRHYTCFKRTHQERHSLIDIPTTIRVLEDSVNRRMRHPDTAHENLEWREVEEQEIQRFIVNLQMLINRHENNPEFKNRIQIVRYNPETPGDLLWLHNLMV